MSIPAPDAFRDECGFTAGGWRQIRRVRVAGVAGRQFGRIRHDQLLTLGVAETTIRRWRDAGYLHRVLPRVYAVGHTAASMEGDLAAALLYAGPGAMLSHVTAAWWLGLLKYPSAEIHVSTPRDVGNHGKIRAHGRRRLERIEHNGLPVTTPSQTLLDFAASGPRRLLRFTLANADYHDMLDTAELARMMGPGVAGSAPLREALAIHLPQLAHTRSRVEILLLEFCERHDLPVPLVNVLLEGWLVDAYWPDRRLVVEVDGWRGHRTKAQLESDHQRDLELRLAGYIVLRYTERQLIETPEAVAAELRRYR